MAYFKSSIAQQKESVVIIAGGVSSSNISRIQNYVNTYSSVVFSANYDYGIPSTYTYYGDIDKCKEQIKNIRHGDIIVKKELKSVARKLANRQCYLVHTDPKGIGIYKTSSVVIPYQDGMFLYSTIGTAGMASIVLSLFCQPKRMLLVGFDGSSPDAATKTKHDGSVVPYGKPKKRAKEVKYLTESLFPSLHKLGIIVETFEDVGFYGLNKVALGLNIID